MAEFPSFVRNTRNCIARSSQYTNDIEGFVWDGADGSQICVWTSHADRTSTEHAHDFDDVLVIEGKCTAIVDGKRIELAPGQGMARASRANVGARSRYRTSSRHLLRRWIFVASSAV